MTYLFSSRLAFHRLRATVLLCLLLALPGAVLAQTVKRDTLEQTQVYTQVEQMPQLSKANRKYTDQEAIIVAIQRACRYPAEALRNRVQGTVLVGFTVNPEGNIRDVRVAKGVQQDLDEATVAAVKMLPQFRPGKQGGQPVAVRYTLPIRWALQ